MKGKIVIYQDGSYHYLENGIVWEFEQDKNYLLTIDLSKINDYYDLNNH